jgi:hypothetical protein
MLCDYWQLAALVKIGHEVKTATVAPLARQLDALTDAGLNQYLKQNNCVISVEDTGQLSRSFIERLR